MVETDQEIVARVRMALANELAIADLDVEVDIVEGVVYLRGEVDAEDEIAQATRVAAAVPGVVDVRNQLVSLPLRRPEVQPEVIWVRRSPDPPEEASS